MKQTLSQKELDQLYQHLVETAKQCTDKNEGRDDAKSKLNQTYGFHSAVGSQFYRSLSDEKLLDLLRNMAREIGHSPSQKEVFWVWRMYIKKRFLKWPYALEAAGLARSAGEAGKPFAKIKQEAREYETLLETFRQKAETLCRIPHPQEVPELSEQIKKYRDSWYEVIQEAGLNPEFFKEKAVYKITDLEPEYVDLLKELKQMAWKLGRPPLKSEVSKGIRSMLTARCGSFRNVLYQIDLEPVIKIRPFSSTQITEDRVRKPRMHRENLQDCLYQVLNLSEADQEDLRKLRDQAAKLDRLPERKEVEVQLRRRLQRSCGSWANALYQLKYFREDMEKR